MENQFEKQWDEKLQPETPAVNLTGVRWCDGDVNYEPGHVVSTFSLIVTFIKVVSVCCYLFSHPASKWN